MSEAKHTPGPWSIHFQPVISKPMAALELSKLVEGTQEFSGVLPMVVGPGGLCTAVTGCGPAGVANARLIAAAPDLLESLKACLQCFAEMTGRKPGFVEDSIAMSKEAITKATGDTA